MPNAALFQSLRNFLREVGQEKRAAQKRRFKRAADENLSEMVQNLEDNTQEVETGERAAENEEDVEDQVPTGVDANEAEEKEQEDLHEGETLDPESTDPDPDVEDKYDQPSDEGSLDQPQDPSAGEEKKSSWRRTYTQFSRLHKQASKIANQALTVIASRSTVRAMYPYANPYVKAAQAGYGAAQALAPRQQLLQAHTQQAVESTIKQAYSTADMVASFLYHYAQGLQKKAFQPAGGDPGAAGAGGMTPGASSPAPAPGGGAAAAGGADMQQIIEQMRALGLTEEQIQQVLSSPDPVATLESILASMGGGGGTAPPPAAGGTAPPSAAGGTAPPSAAGGTAPPPPPAGGAAPMKQAQAEVPPEVQQLIAQLLALGISPEQIQQLLAGQNPEAAQAAMMAASAGAPPSEVAKAAAAVFHRQAERFSKIAQELPPPEMAGTTPTEPLPVSGAPEAGVSPEDSIQQLIMALIEMGVTPEQLQQAIAQMQPEQAAMAAGAPPAADAQKVAAYRQIGNKIKSDLGRFAKIASQRLRHQQAAGRFRYIPPKTAYEKRLRAEIQSCIRDIFSSQ